MITLFTGGHVIADADEPLKSVFNHLNDCDWNQAFYDKGDGKWQDQWFLDGEFATITNTPRGMVFSSGPERGNHAHHAVLWTKESFAGDVKIEFDFTLVDGKSSLNLIYIQATGRGGKFDKDISKWSDLRKTPFMRNYFNTMNLLHISFAGSRNGKEYLRLRRYPKVDENANFAETVVPPTYWEIGLFKPGETCHLTFIKKGKHLFMHGKKENISRLFHWDISSVAPISEGRIGLRQMWTRSARYQNFTIQTLNQQ